MRCKLPAFWKIHDEPRKAVPCSDLNDHQNAIGNDESESRRAEGENPEA